MITGKKVQIFHQEETTRSGKLCRSFIAEWVHFRVHELREDHNSFAKRRLQQDERRFEVGEKFEVEEYTEQSLIKSLRDNLGEGSRWDVGRLAFLLASGDVRG